MEPLRTRKISVSHKHQAGELVIHMTCRATITGDVFWAPAPPPLLQKQYVNSVQDQRLCKLSVCKLLAVHVLPLCCYSSYRYGTSSINGIPITTGVHGINNRHTNVHPSTNDCWVCQKHSAQAQGCSSRYVWVACLSAKLVTISLSVMGVRVMGSNLPTLARCSISADRS